MADNTVIACPGDQTRTLKVGSNVAPGSPVKVGSYVGVCLTGSGDTRAKVSYDESYPADSTDRSIVVEYPNNPFVENANEGTVALAGVFLLPVAALTAENAIQGTAVNIDAEGKLTTGVGTLFGAIYSVPSDYATSGLVAVELNGGK